MKRKPHISDGLVLITTLLLMSAATVHGDISAREQTAREVVDAFIKGLGNALINEMTKGGPSGAIGVCTEIAPEIASKLSKEHGWRVTRVGTRVRNPMIGMPDAWEQRVLAQFSERANKGESFKEMSYAEAVSEPGGTYFRYMKAIGVKGVCLTCHGPKERIPESVQVELQNHYPSDQATGYEVGDLRGAISIKQPIEPSR